MVGPQVSSLSRGGEVDEMSALVLLEWCSEQCPMCLRVNREKLGQWGTEDTLGHLGLLVSRGYQAQRAKKDQRYDDVNIWSETILSIATVTQWYTPLSSQHYYHYTITVSAITLHVTNIICTV